MSVNDPIAVVGMSGLFPSALDLTTLWENIRTGVDATAEVRPQRWFADPARMTSPRLEPDKAYSARCCLLPDFDFDPRGLDLDPAMAAALDPLYQVVLTAGREAVTGPGAPVLDRARTGVILAAIVLPTDSSSALTREILGPAVEAAVCGESKRDPAPTPQNPTRFLSARVAGLPAALLSKALGLGGGSTTLDAACASSLFAVKLACDELAAGRLDAVLAGGVSRPDCLFTQVGFSQLRALSPSGRCAPFDRGADGLVVGEGAGILVLKRLSDALRDKDAVFGLIRGIGLSNDLRGNLLAPDSEGQLRAMRSAYAAAGWTPQDVEFIECHGAGTPVGDATELASLTRLWGETGWTAGQCALGSVKSMIGHLLTAAGAAGTIKTLLALRHGTLPPTIHFSGPPDKSPLHSGPFRVPTAAEPWPRRADGRPRRAAVSAFGFGGINAHLLLEEWDVESASGRRHLKAKGRTAKKAGKKKDAGRRPEVAICGMAALMAGAPSLEQFKTAVVAGRPLFRPRPQGRWKGCDWVLPGLRDLQGCFLEEIAVGRGEFHIPPREIPDILPQHLLMLKAAAAAMADAGMPHRTERPRMGAVIGIDFDFGATDFHLRWYLEHMFPQWVRARHPHLGAAEAADWLTSLKDACSAPLTADRVLGALGSMVASRIAREFRLGGPSFVVSAGEASGLRALAIGARAIQSGELEAVLIGAVDLCGDPRAVALEHALHPLDEPGPGGTGAAPGEGAVALVLKRSGRAVEEGRVYARVRGIGVACGSDAASLRPDAAAYLHSLTRAVEDARVPPESIGLLVPHGGVDPAEGRIEAEALNRWGFRRAFADTSNPARAVFGRCGAVSGLASLAAAALRLHQAAGLPNGDAEPPRAAAAAMTGDGNCVHVILEGRSASPTQQGIFAPEKKPEPSPAKDPDTIRIPVAGRPLIFPPAPDTPARRPAPPEPQRRPQPVLPPSPAQSPSLLQGIASVSEATARAHTAFLEASSVMTRACAEAIEIQSRLMRLAGAFAPAAVRPPLPAFTRLQCLEFARGSAAQVLGPEFAEVDGFKARVRLPDEPLMLVDRILMIEGRKGTLGPGKIVTEHDVLPGAWYLDGGRAPVCIAVEAGQADLFLCAWLGIDLTVRGRRTYRLLDATVEFHRGLPQPGETIRYAIEIDKFLRQGETWLFLFRFKGSIEGTPLITMTAGCAGFFTAAEVEKSGGIILTEEDRRPLPGRRPSDWSDPVPMAAESYDETGLEALREGDLAACFGQAFSGIILAEGLRLPGGRMRLIDRVLELEPHGGRYGLGRIRAEADIRPDAWFLTCHFVDDMVMPGTLMYECCSHALRVFLQRLGWVAEGPGLRYEPVPGLAATLKCRGPVTPATRRVVYAVDIKELGYGPEPFAVADADMVADGHHIVRFSDMSLKLSGMTRADVESFWAGRPAPAAPAPEPGPQAPLCEREQLIEFANGRPSAAFGDPYRPFDEGRFIARLPAPPYLFIDRIRRSEPPPWVLKPGGWAEAEYEVPAGAWYLAAERSGAVPYCVLLEAALQPCGWLAAYMGSALKSEKPLHFRNLGGYGTIRRAVSAETGRLSMRARLTHVSEVTDMIIEHFDFEIRDAQGPVYDGSTYFGFFTRASLARQEGIRDDRDKNGETGPDAAGVDPVVVFKDEPPLTPEDPRTAPASGLAFPSKALRMIDRIDLFQPEGGAHGLGFIRGSKEIDPADWYFKAHFHQDPVCPGSLGIESFIQLLKFAALKRRPELEKTHRFAQVNGQTHRWVYRGQILPANRRVTVEATVTRVGAAPHPVILATGRLLVDGLTIYRMEDFGIRLVPIGEFGEPEQKAADHFFTRALEPSDP